MITFHLSQVLSQPKRLGGAAVAVLSACLIGLIGQACYGPTPPTRIACGSCENQDRIVRLQPRNMVSAQESPQFTHPFNLSREDWTLILKNIRVQKHNEVFLFFTTKGPVEPAFTDDEIDFLSVTLNRVFAQARPDERVVFALSRHRSSDLTEITSGGWFVEGPSLHLVLANYRYAVTMPTVRELLWQDPLWSKAGPFYDLVPGEHQTVEEVESSPRQLFSPTLPSLSIAYKPLLLGEVAPQPTGRKSAAPGQLSPPPDQTSPSSLSLEERLQILKRLKDQELITDEEYRAKKRQLLDQF
ncbi:MAG TPA: SHOCT domain-containing protein [Nitrospiraceae bacterium]|nr:SHOCT domain-containing protein [Nitrospiraceae bacterium]